MPTDKHRDPRALDLLRRTRYGRISVSIGALPFVTVARHTVSGADVLLRLHRGHGYHRACDGNVVAYGVDTAGSEGPAGTEGPAGGGPAGLAGGGPAGGDTPSGGHSGHGGPSGTPAADEFWSVQCVGTARAVHPEPDELRRLGPVPRLADDAPYDPVYLRLRPRFVTVHHIAGIAASQAEHSP
ncbi:pyridoxamine 5'-phosphate oxidase family protein [Streptomyces sp. XD-27]|uniref:pyridoxamine 5'-phosphate oxidase family protein n=1 Tax=Streptomyces sp. XD-27 TaxID=3062779 RepID=UPI0026F4540A|nr:pyridoxamine 5'-phosphate oxidase family protein [Streptomyces sp. XD-27]WKX71441.1 pyridoxamine 5'-phosphate oxidase family protein [Streptomyces sp. XD-27]